MKKLLVGILVLTALGCSRDRDTSATAIAIDGKNGTSCSVAPEYAKLEESSSSVLIGAKISCTDGSFATILNGAQGPQGIQGPQGVQGPQGQAGKSCQTYQTKWFDGVWLKCPNEFPVFISNGRDGNSCSSTRLKDKVKITCGEESVSYVYDGSDGKDGTSCTVKSAKGGANVTCGQSTVFLANGTDGKDGLNGADGKNGEDAVQPGLLCNVHDLKSWSGETSLPQALANNAPVGSFVLANLSVPDSQSSKGFPGMPKALQDKVGLEGYALDCNGYLNIKTTGQHTLKLLSDDGARLVIEDNFLEFEDQGLHAPRTVSKTGLLYKGQNKFNVMYFQGPHTQVALELRMSGPNTSEAVVSASEFTH